MGTRLDQYREIANASFPSHERGMDRLGAASIFMIVGVTLSGIWQFFAHKPDPAWVSYQPDAGFDAASSNTGGAQIHDFFATGAGVVALVGTVWFAVRIAHNLPWANVVVVVGLFVVALSGGVIRYNLIRINGASLDEVGGGYLQLFTEDVDYVVASPGQVRPGVFRALVAAHIVSVPLLLGFGWWSIARAVERRGEEIRNAPQRGRFAKVRRAGEG